MVDIAVLRTLDALQTRQGNVLLASHDADFAAAVAKLVNGRRRVGVLGFKEFIATSYRDMEAKGLEVHDLEAGRAPSTLDCLGCGSFPFTNTIRRFSYEAFAFSIDGDGRAGSLRMDLWARRWD